jgi:hypothetical protein
MYTKNHEGGRCFPVNLVSFKILKIIYLYYLFLQQPFRIPPVLFIML